VRTADGNDCPLTLIADRRGGGTPTWSALVVIDDRTEMVRDDDPEYRRRWAGWLYWGNLIQFLDSGGGDGAQLAVTTLDAFDPAELAVCEGTGLVLARRALELDEETATWLGRAAAAEPEPAPEALDEAKADRRWREVLALLFPDESGLESLVRGLIARSVPLPKQGYELGDAGWQAELAWPDRRIAVMVAGELGDHETADRDKAYAAEGWDARSARQWTVDELVEKIMVTSWTSREGK
jgi:hypothetical protein